MIQWLKISLSATECGSDLRITLPSPQSVTPQAPRWSLCPNCCREAPVGTIGVAASSACLLCCYYHHHIITCQRIPLCLGVSKRTLLSSLKDVVWSLPPAKEETEDEHPSRLAFPMMGDLPVSTGKNPPAIWEYRFDTVVGKIPWRRGNIPLTMFSWRLLWTVWSCESDTTEWRSLHFSSIDHFTTLRTPFYSFILPLTLYSAFWL